MSSTPEQEARARLEAHALLDLAGLGADCTRHELSSVFNVQCKNLVRHLLTEREKLDGALRARQEVMAERDRFEEQIGDIVASVGLECEWTNLHDHADCVAEAFGALEQQFDGANARADGARAAALREAEAPCRRGNVNRFGATERQLDYIGHGFADAIRSLIPTTPPTSAATTGRETP